MTRALVLAAILACAYVLTHRVRAGCALVCLGLNLLPRVEPPEGMAERIETRMLDTYCRACPTKQRVNGYNAMVMP